MASAAETIDFAHDVVPILKTHCVECHGNGEAKGGFAIDTQSLFLESGMAEAGDVDGSYFLELIASDDADVMMPPPEKPRVSKAELAILRGWVREGLPWEAGFTFGKRLYEPPLEPRRPTLPPIVAGRMHPIDRLIDAALVRDGASFPPLVDDTTFLRRASLDLVGLLPTAEQTRHFLADPSPDKRDRLIDSLLARDRDYTEHWLTFWNDLLRNDYAGTGFITKGRTQISGWLYESLLAKKPFDQMVRELVAPPTDASAGFINGIKWRGTVSAGQTLPIQFSQSVSQSLLGINMKCASCHDSFVDRWTLADAYGLAAIYSEQPLELHRCDKPTGRTAEAAWLFREIGDVDPLAPREERLRQLGDLLVHPQNGRVPRTIVNRLYAALMGRGIVHPLDAMQTEPWDADLLDWLAADFQDHGYDLKRTLRLIATSRAYQSRSTRKVEETEEVTTFGGPHPKRLTAEQFVDAVWRLSGSAPRSFDAPVQRTAANPELAKRLSFPSSWVWGPSVDEGPPPHGERIVLRRDFTIEGAIASAGVIGAADNTFVLYVNGRRVISGENWTDLQAEPLRDELRVGPNRILVFAQNTGPKPNPAGVFAAVRIAFEDGTEQTIITDDRWLVATNPPDQQGLLRDPDAIDWGTARQLPNVVWKKKTDARIGSRLAMASDGTTPPVRASLMNADRLMRSLGRPNRDQIVTSRPNELTTLEAIDLATSEELLRDLNRAASNLIAATEGQPAVALIDELYLVTLTRPPSPDERILLQPLLESDRSPEAVADVLWALLMTPEFLLVR